MEPLCYISVVPLAFAAQDEYGIYNANPCKDGGVGMALTRNRDSLTVTEEAVIETRMKELDGAFQLASTTADELLMISVDEMMKNNPESKVTISENATCLITFNKFSVSTTSLDDYHMDIRIRELQKWGEKQPYAVFIGEKAVEFLSRNLFDAKDSPKNKLSPTAIPFRPGSISPILAPSNPKVVIPPNPDTIIAGGLKVKLPEKYEPTTLALISRGVLSEDEIRPKTNLVAQSSKYRGSMTSHAMRTQMKMMPDHLNCALFITNIPITVTASDIFNRITSGRVVCLHMYEPDARHTTKAAKLVFAEPIGARIFLNQLKSVAGRRMDNYDVEVVYNRHGQPRYESGLKSRVLFVEGPSEKMTLDFWKEYFSFFSKFELENFRMKNCQDPKLKRFEFRFVRIDGQAETCMGAIKNNNSFNGVFRTWYGHDPCDQPLFRFRFHS